MKSIFKTALTSLSGLILFFIYYLAYAQENRMKTDKLCILKMDSVEVELPASIKCGTTTLKKVRDHDLQLDFDETLELFNIQAYSPNQIILNIGKNPPLSDSIVITVQLPATKIPSNYAWQLFAKVYQDGGEEILDLFDLIPSKYSSSGSSLIAHIPAYAFTNNRTADSTYEAIFQLGTVQKNLR